ncbi:MAG TPA: adenosine-specific kinase [Ktedonobacterales bacterium]|nr:adenosine-specific kinase [Ktedonobacterales bacterium]
MDLKVISINKPEDVNLILGQAHFIKTVEDLHEALVGSVPGIKFGLAFCESSGPALVRWSGTDPELTETARANVRELGAGHAFLILLRETFPINVLPAVRAVQEVCSIYCASANPVQVIVAETEQGRGILGVIDGIHTKGIETEQDIAERKALLRRFGYKQG